MVGRECSPCAFGERVMAFTLTLVKVSIDMLRNMDYFQSEIWVYMEI